jgi:hypothetical protein
MLFGGAGSLGSDAVNELAIAAGRLADWLPSQDRVLWARQALYVGIFGGLGATLGWFTWAALAILMAHPHEVWVSASVGAVVGTVVDGSRRYREIARSASTEVHPRSQIPGRPAIISKQIIVILPND